MDRCQVSGFRCQQSTEGKAGRAEAFEVGILRFRKSRRLKIKNPGTTREYLSSRNKLADVWIWKANGQVPGHTVD